MVFLFWLNALAGLLWRHLLMTHTVFWPAIYCSKPVKLHSGGEMRAAATVCASAGRV